MGQRLSQACFCLLGFGRFVLLVWQGSGGNACGPPSPPKGRGTSPRAGDKHCAHTAKEFVPLSLRSAAKDTLVALNPAAVLGEGPYHLAVGTCRPAGTV